MEGIVIRELMNPKQNGNINQSIAEATFQSGSLLYYHYHKQSEKIYHITEGEGVVKRGNELVKVHKGDTIFISAGVPHSAENTGCGEMKLLCILSPPFNQEDVVLVE